MNDPNHFKSCLKLAFNSIDFYVDSLNSISTTESDEYQRILKRPSLTEGFQIDNPTFQETDALAGSRTGKPWFV